MKKETKIRVIFCIFLVIILTPLALFFVFENLLNKNINDENFSKNWDLSDNYSHEVIDLPLDLRQKKYSNQIELTKTTKIPTVFNDSDDIGISLGIVGDNVRLTINNCIITDEIINTKAWRWGHLKYFYIPKACINENETQKITLSVVYHGISSKGIYHGPIGFFKFSKFSSYFRVAEFLRFDVFFIFGIFLILSIATYVFISQLLVEKRENFFFAMLVISIGFQLIGLSSIPYIYISGQVGIYWSFFSAIIALHYLFQFYQYKYDFKKKYPSIAISFSFGLFIASLLKYEMSYIFIFYQAFFILIIVSLVYFLFDILMIVKKTKKLVDKDYLIALIILIITVFLDIYFTVDGSLKINYIPYGFLILLLIGFLSLAKEYAKAFSQIEDQVVQRTIQLNRALIEIKEIQHLKDDQAKRFAHDIRSPLAALQVLRNIVSHQLQDDARDLFKHTIVRINDLANTALPKLMGLNNPIIKTQTAVFLWPILDKLVSEKRLEYKYLSELTIELKNLSPIFELHAFCDEVEFTRMISNLINNSIESRKLDQSLLISIYIEKNNFQIEISVEDFGRGIPEHLISKVFESGFTYGKKDGMGVGLTHTKKIVESWGGKVNIDSKVNLGTNIKLQLPISESPQWLLTKLNLTGIENLVIIDDQSFVVDTWRQKLSEIANSPNLLWVQNGYSWAQSEASKLDFKTTLFLVDYDLASSTSGLELIKQFKLYLRAILVTGNDDELDLRRKAMDLEVKILPKALIHSIPITFKDV